MFNRSAQAKAQTSNGLERSLIPFLSANYQRINVARLQHLDYLGLAGTNKTVVDLGAGVGDHSLYYLFHNHSVLAVEGRQELVSFIGERLGIRSTQIDFESDLGKMPDLGKFDIIHCFGLLYHLSNPKDFIHSLKGLGNLLFMETCVSADDSADPVNLIKEDKLNSTQAISGTGCRPTRQWVFDTLKEVFPFVYIPLTQPKNEQFPVSWTTPMQGSGNKRAVFIASTGELDNEKLTSNLVKEYRSW
jgi:hypothetical protein